MKAFFLRGCTKDTVQIVSYLDACMRPLGCENPLSCGCHSFYLLLFRLFLEPSSESTFLALQGMQILQARTLDLKEYSDTHIDRSGAPVILNYGARKRSAEGHGM